MLQVLYPRAWIDGRIVDTERPAIRSDDAGLLFGWGAFETLRLYSGVPFDLKAHLSRMRPTTARLGLRADLSEPQVRRAIRALVRANRIRGDSGLRITITRGPWGGRPRLILHARRLVPPPETLRARGIRLAVMPWRREPQGPLVGHKTLNYLEHGLAREAARVRRADEALYLDPRGRALEGSWSSLFAVFGRSVVTPSLDQGILPGITRARVIRTVRSMGLRLLEGPLPLARLMRAAEVFVTSSTTEVLPVRSVDGRPLRQGETWRRVWEAYRAQVSRAVGSAT